MAKEEKGRGLTLLLSVCPVVPTSTFNGLDSFAYFFLFSFKLLLFLNSVGQTLITFFTWSPRARRPALAGFDPLWIVPQQGDQLDFS